MIPAGGTTLIFIAAFGLLLGLGAGPVHLDAQQSRWDVVDIRPESNDVRGPLIDRQAWLESGEGTLNNRWALALPAVFGSTLGAFAGAAATGHGLWAAGADYSNTMYGVIAGAAVGGTFGSAALAWWALPDGSDATFLRALAGAAIGILPGFGIAALTQSAGPGAFVGFGLGQGITTAVILAR